jgi:hypothetical protein
MTRAGAERAVIVSSLVVIATYSYRLLTEGHSSRPAPSPIKQLIGVGAPPNLGQFITGWGFSFFVLAVISEAAPQLGGALAILVATSDVLANFGQVATDVNTKLGVKGPPGPQGPAGLQGPVPAGAH